MEYLEYRFTLDMHKSVSQISLPVRQFETNRRLLITFSNNGSTYTITDGCTAVFAATKADGTTLFDNCTIKENTIIVYEFNDQTTSALGIVESSIILYGPNSEVIASPNFVIIVNKNAVEYSDVKSTSESTTIATMLANEETRQSNEETRQSGYTQMQNSISSMSDEVEEYGKKVVTKIYFDETDGKLVLTLAGGETITIDGAWISEITDAGGNIPPSATAVKSYVEGKETALKGLAIGIPKFDKDTGKLIFKTLDGKQTNTDEINILLESEFGSGEYDAENKELVIKFKNSDNEVRLPAKDLLCPTWVSDIEKISDEQKATPPTADAVKSYIDDKTTFDKTYDTGKFVIVGNDGSLTTSNVGKYRHNVNVKSYEGFKLNVDVYAVVYTNSPDVMSWSDIFHELLDPTMMGDAYPCQGVANHGKSDAISLSYSETPNSNDGYDECVHIKYRTNNGIETQTLYISECIFEDRIADYDIGVLKESISKNKSDVKDLTHRVDNLEDVLVEEKVETSEEYITPVPENVGRYALLNEVGGITHRVENVLYTFDDVSNGYLEAPSDIFSIAELDLSNVDTPVSLVANSISGDVKLYLSNTDAGSSQYAETYISPSETEATYGTNFDTCYLTYEIGQGTYSWENLRVVTYELQSAKVTAIESRGKNLIPFPYTELGGAGTSATKNGVTATVNGNRSISLVGTADITGNGAFYFTLCYIEGLGDTFYGNSWLDFSGGSNGTCYFSPRVMYDANNGGVMVFIKDGETLNETIYPQIEYGTIGTEYAPYREPITYTLPGVITRREEYGLGIVYKDKVYSNTIDFENKKYYPNRAKKKVYDGTEDIGSSSPNATPNVFYIQGLSGPYIDGICNHYPNITNRELWNGSKNGALFENGYELWVRDMSVNSIEEFRSKLAEWAANGNPLQVVCAFDDNTAEDIDVDDVIEVEPEGTLVALNTNERGAYTKVSYIIAKGGSAE